MSALTEAPWYELRLGHIEVAVHPDVFRKEADPRTDQDLQRAILIMLGARSVNTVSAGVTPNEHACDGQPRTNGSSCSNWFKETAKQTARHCRSRRGRAWQDTPVSTTSY